jgi:hypothetical protein
VTDQEQRTLLISLLEEAREQTAWLKLIGLQSAEYAARANLRTVKQRDVYRLSDGRSVREIADEARVGVGTVSRLWAEWAAMGLVKESNMRKGRWERILPLAMLDLTTQTEV